jgi:hypothetical protein
MVRPHGDTKIFATRGRLEVLAFQVPNLGRGSRNLLNALMDPKMLFDQCRLVSAVGALTGLLHQVLFVHAPANTAGRAPTLACDEE